MKNYYLMLNLLLSNWILEFKIIFLKLNSSFDLYTFPHNKQELVIKYINWDFIVEDSPNKYLNSGFDNLTKSLIYFLKKKKIIIWMKDLIKK